MTKRELLTRSCIVCGLEKPLSAFLQIGKNGTVYGAICYSCRSAGKTEKPKSLHEDERSSTSSGMRIGAKQRLEIEKKQKSEFQDRQQKREEFDKKIEKNSQENTERLEKTEKAEKDHRETFIEEKKKGFLDYKSKKLPVTIKTLIGQTRNEQAPIRAQITEDKIRKEELTKKEEAYNKHEDRVTTLDAVGSPLLTTLSRDNPIFREYLLRLPGDAPLVKAYSHLRNSNAKQTQAAKAEKTSKETAQEFIEKTWGPSSRKR